MARKEKKARPTMTANAVSEIIQNNAPEANSDKFFFFTHISSYPNENPSFYKSAWKAFPKIENQAAWFYVKDQTQDYFCRRPLTEIEADEHRKQVKKYLQEYAQDKKLAGNHGGKKKLSYFRINVLLTKAFKYETFHFRDDQWHDGVPPPVEKGDNDADVNAVTEGLANTSLE
eukprot:TRINITY_DN19393_c0_g1::TRINITY_DN19393_c0_g1_i1::g.7839::m.7839 TRINITY_DN19393_c0_g1::TRINITY_DN19393_c0_g1_i1::g.7839  ORF type:complete len:188 (+),score=16.34,RseA_C/PF03873.8/9.7e+02,RseA_C/PF03873.8/0.1 TRINITY_DN19393_c0_g1_i1:47-565(+)